MREMGKPFFSVENQPINEEEMKEVKNHSGQQQCQYRCEWSMDAKMSGWHLEKRHDV